MSSQHRVVIYSTPTCPDCVALKRWLNGKNIPFVEHDLRGLAVAEVKNRAGVRIAPITVIDEKHIFRNLSRSAPADRGCFCRTNRRSIRMIFATLPQAGRRIAVTDGQTILQAELDAGIAYPRGCCSGRCGSCKSSLIDGRVELGKRSPFALSEDEKAAGLILACRALPLRDVTVEIVAVAGGRGLAPIDCRDCARCWYEPADPPYFGARTEDDLYLVDHFRALEQRFSNLDFVPVLSEALATPEEGVKVVT